MSATRPAEDHREEIEEVLKGADMVFVTAGEGAGDRHGGAPSLPRSRGPSGADHRRGHEAVRL